MDSTQTGRFFTAARFARLGRLARALPRGWLERLRPGGRRPVPVVEAPPEGARFLALRYEGEAGSLGYRLYIPSGHRGRPAPLIVMLHGCTQTAEDFAAGTRMNVLAEAQTCLVAYPEQEQGANANRCWNWFRPEDQRRDQGEAALIAGIARRIMDEHAVDPRRVHVAGLSAGGAEAVIMGRTYPDLFAAIGVHSGLPFGAAQNARAALAAMRDGAAPAPRAVVEGPVLPTIVFHGDGDTIVNPRNGELVIADAAAAAAAAGLRSEVQQGQVPGGHAYTRSIRLDAAGRPVLEQWVVHGGGHGWSGGSGAGSWTDPLGPDASREMLRFFLQHRRDAV